MRIAVLADIHGNLRALEAVQADLRRHAPDVVLNLGDHVSGPLQAAATADLLIDSGYLHIRGNHDRQLLDRPPEKMGPSDRAAFEQLSAAHKQWLRELPRTRMFDGRILLCHGTPEDDLEYLLEEVHDQEVRLASPDLIQQRLGNIAADLVLCGHTHIPRAVSAPGGPVIVNPGSIGLPAYDDTHRGQHYVETGSPHARYAIIDRKGNSLKVDLIAIEYDWTSAAREAAAANRPDWAHALATGYALRS
ncbi:MAG TPA: metallophosphoesterase family protein [Bryobacteraceae bacterium]